MGHMVSNPSTCCEMHVKTMCCMLFYPEELARHALQADVGCASGGAPPPCAPPHTAPPAVSVSYTMSSMYVFNALTMTGVYGWSPHTAF